MDDLPKELDLIVVGTGFQESVIAAAASRVGKSVLHIDENEFYGGLWASFNLENFVSHLSRFEGSQDDAACRIRNVTQRWFEFTDEISEIDGWNKEKIEKDSRRFNIDLVPKLNYCNGKLVELLISSNICRYTEFRAVDKVLTARNGQLDIVPASRGDIFTKKNVSIIEKRLLMKFITQCVDYKKETEQKEDSFDFEDDGKFIELMKQQKLTDNLIHYILYAMCMGNSETTFKQGIERIRLYLTSIGRYGNTPYLFPMFGCGEIPQCFCRLSAVFGGIYWLGQNISDVKTVENNDEKVVSIKFGEQIVTAKKLVCGLDSKIIDQKLHPHNYISRAVFITTKPVGGSSVNSEMDGGGVVLLYHPIEGRSEGVTMIQLSHYTSCISKGLYLVHLSTPCVDGAEKDLREFVETFFKADYIVEDDCVKPTIIYSAYFEIPCSVKEHDYTSSQEGPIYYCSGVFSELDYDESIRQSRLLYSRMYPDDEFLPKAPEPEEIIIGDEDESNVNVNLGVLADLVEADAGNEKPKESDEPAAEKVEQEVNETT